MEEKNKINQIIEKDYEITKIDREASHYAILSAVTSCVAVFFLMCMNETEEMTLDISFIIGSLSLFGLSGASLKKTLKILKKLLSEIEKYKDLQQTLKPEEITNLKLNLH